MMHHGLHMETVQQILSLAGIIDGSLKAQTEPPGAPFCSLIFISFGSRPSPFLPS